MMEAEEEKPSSFSPNPPLFVPPASRNVLGSLSLSLNRQVFPWDVAAEWGGTVR